MSATAAAVIDLETFRRERQERQRPACPMPARLSAPALLVPFWVTWVPVWPVA